jgi:glycosyltransferase involved in cell wall biosynthesis
MRIGYDATYVTDKRTGLGAQSYNLLQALVEADSPHEFIAFTGSDVNLDELADHGRLQLMPVPQVGNPGSRLGSVFYRQILLHQAVKRAGISLMHFPYYVEPILTRAPFILTIHDMDTYAAPYRHSAATRIYQNGLLRLLSRRAAAVVTVSDFSRQEILKHLPGARGKVRIVRNGLPACFLNGRADAGVAAANAFRPSDKPYFLYTGGLGTRKNLRRMVKAFAMARTATGSEAELLVTGELAEVGHALVTFVRENGLEDWVRFTGYVPDEAMPALYRGAVAALYPSLYEGFGLPVLEAMASGTPMVTSKDSPMEEVANGAAVLVNPRSTTEIAAAIGALMMDSELAARLGARGPARAAIFSWENAARQCLSIYEEFLREHDH